MIIALLEITKVFVFIFAIYKLINNKDYTIYESISLSIISVIILLSSIYQISFLIRHPFIAFYIEGILFITSIIFIYSQLKLKRIKLVLYSEGKIFEILFYSLMGLVLFYLFAQVLVLKPNNIDSHIYTLSRVLLFQQEQTIFLENTSNYHQAIFPLGFDILNHMFLRHHIESGIGFFNFLSYLGIIFSCLSLCKQFYSHKISILSTMAIVSMPQIVYEATTPKSDIVIGYLSCLILHLTFKYKITSKNELIPIILLLLLFGLSCKLTFLAFIVIYVPVFLIFSRKELKSLFSYIKAFKHLTIMFVGFAFFLSGMWLWMWNYINWGGISGPTPFVDPASNTDGLMGVIANFFRYIFESCHIPGYIHLLFVNHIGIDLMSYLQLLYDNLFYPIFKNHGIALGYNFEVNWFQNEHSWYGPLGFLFFPFSLIAFLKGRSQIKIVSIITLFIFVCICYKLSWSPMKDRYFIFMYTPATIIFAYILNCLKFFKSSVFQYTLLFLFVCLTYLSVFLNNTKPLFNFLTLRFDKMFYSSFVLGENVWAKTNYGSKNYWGNIHVDSILLDIPPSKIALFQVGQRRTYPFLIRRPDCIFKPMERRINDPNNHLFRNPVYPAELIGNFDYILLVGNTFKFLDSNNLVISGQKVNLENKHAKLVKSIDNFNIKFLKLTLT
jgi:hypothetical protein